ncbi:uncharacterized protein A4U43_C04F8970 [Asparagus officinalis]|uniref:Uncharacterized protein n=1 Tax=Asparagus officinalis TaxID=4686 RepID=A0A5P1EZC9_ASPOF|nr:uncharacterized protein A4U43_C04F8970 [Asparagus officinalis]
MPTPSTSRSPLEEIPPLDPLRRLSDGHRLRGLHGRRHGLPRRRCHRPLQSLPLLPGHHRQLRRIPFVSDPVFVSPSEFVTSESDFGSSNFLIVTKFGCLKSRLLGVMLAAFLVNENLEFAPVVVDDSEVLDLVTDEIVQRIRSYLKLGSPSLGPDGRWSYWSANGHGYKLGGK